MSFLTSRTASSSTSTSTISLLRSAARPLLRPTTITTTIPRRSMARMTIIGRLGGSPEIVATSTGLDVIRYAMATSYGPRENRQTSWWRVACFAPEGSKTRDVLTSIGKGSLVCVEGDCSMAKYTDKDGMDRTGLKITQRNIEVLERREAVPEGEQFEAAEGMGQ